MSSGGGNTTTTQRTEIPAFLQPFLQRQAQVGTGALERLEPMLAGAGADRMVTPFTADQISGLQGMSNLARGAGGFIPTAQDTFMRTARGDFLHGGQGFDEAVQASMRAAQPGIISTFGGAGGSPGGLAQVAMQQAASDSFANLFNAERARQMGAAQILPGMGALPFEMLLQSGGMQQAQMQQQLQAPLIAEQLLFQLGSGGLPLGGLLGQSQTSPTSGSGFMGALGGAGTGASIGGAIGGPWGAGIGAGIGAFGGLLS